jgi:hypothetical protein
MVYGQAYSSFLAGTTDATYTLVRTPGDPITIDTAWDGGRVMTQLDIEMGFRWVSPCEHWRLTAGYVFSGWFNTVKTEEWINAVNDVQFEGMGSTLTFDGLRAGVEFRF